MFFSLTLGVEILAMDATDVTNELFVTSVASIAKTV